MRPLSLYDRWAPTYADEPHNPLMAAEQHAMRRALSSASGTDALDLGAGSGRYGRWLRARGFAVVVSVDLSMAMLRRHTHAAGRVCADATALPLRHRCLDVIVAGLAFGEARDLRPIMAEAGRVLRPGGWLVYSDFDPGWPDRGWRRTFRDASGHECEVPLVAHQPDDHAAALAAAGFDSGPPDVVSLQGQPALLVWRARRRSEP